MPYARRTPIPHLREPSGFCLPAERERLTPFDSIRDGSASTHSQRPNPTGAEPQGGDCSIHPTLFLGSLGTFATQARLVGRTPQVINPMHWAVIFNALAFSGVGRMSFPAILWYVFAASV